MSRVEACCVLCFEVTCRLRQHSGLDRLLEVHVHRVMCCEVVAKWFIARTYSPRSITRPLCWTAWTSRKYSIQDCALTSPNVFFTGSIHVSFGLNGPSIQNLKRLFVDLPTPWATWNVHNPFHVLHQTAQDYCHTNCHSNKYGHCLIWSLSGVVWSGHFLVTHGSRLVIVWSGHVWSLSGHCLVTVW